MPTPLDIAGRLIGPGHPPYVIAELSGNHNGDIERALRILEAAKACGADAVKLQTYTPDTMTIDCAGPDFTVRGGLWDGYTLYQLYEKAHTPWDWHERLFSRGRELGLTVFSTPFDPSAVDFLERFSPPAYKIASFELVDLPLIRRVARTGKPIILSTGMADLEEISDAVRAARESGCANLALLHCVSAYPAAAEEFRLGTLQDLARRFDVVTGISDHTLGIAVAVAAVALGAGIVEKHFTLSRADGGVDSAFSLEPAELAQLTRDARTAFAARAGARESYRRVRTEEPNLVFRRSIYAVRDIQAGEPLTTENIRIIRPGYGLPPKEWDHVLGKRAACFIARGTGLQKTLIAD